MPDAAGTLLWVWRHPRPRGAEGRCIGHEDVPVDPRKAKRLAHRVRRTARREGLPCQVWTSPLRRAAAVGRWLRRWGWRHDVHAALREMDFGRWDGQPWQRIPQAEVEAWCADFLHHRPGGGENVQALFERVAAWQPRLHPPAHVAGRAAAVVVSHGGWMIARRWLASGEAAPARADQWPAPPPHDACWRLPSAVCLPVPSPSGEVTEGSSP